MSFWSSAAYLPIISEAAIEIITQSDLGLSAQSLSPSRESGSLEKKLGSPLC